MTQILTAKIPENDIEADRKECASKINEISEKNTFPNTYNKKEKVQIFFFF